MCAFSVVYQDSGVVPVFKGLCVGILALLLGACGAPRLRHLGPQVPGAPTASTVPLPGKVYRVDQSRSELRILVYRAGPLARLGHNHVLVNRSIHGTANLAEAGESVFSLDIPAAAFVVDDSQARRDEGADFEGDISDDAKAGTLRNMLSTSLLDADEFPQITLSGSAEVQGMPGAATLTATVLVSVVGHESKLLVPLTLHIDAGRLSATGSLDLRQSALGLTPYSLMLGALQVQDAMTIKFRIVASLSPEA